MLQSKAVRVGTKVAAGAGVSAYYAHYKRTTTTTNTNKKKSATTSNHPSAFMSIPTFTNFNTTMYSTDQPRTTNLQESQQQQQQQQDEPSKGFASYLPKFSNIFTPSTEETDAEILKLQQQKAAYQERIEAMNPEERINFEREQNKVFRYRSERIVARDTPVSKDSALVDDGHQQVVVPCRVFPDWKPMDESEATNLPKKLQYYAEHVLDFFRNRADDLGWVVTGDLHDIVADPKRYDLSWETKHPLLKFNPYYEAIYRGWYDDVNIRLKFGGSVPYWEYSQWLRFQQPRPKVYLDFLIPSSPEEANNLEALENKIPERVVIQLYADILPKSTENFIGLAEGFIDHNRFLSYNHTLVHRVDKGHGVFCGDVLRRDGTAGLAFKQTHSRRFLEDENFKLPIDGPGCLVYDNSGPNTNTSHFWISQRAMPELNGRYVCFGHVIEGMGTIQKMNNLPLNVDGSPVYPVEITDSGVLIQDPTKDDPFNLFRKNVPEFAQLGRLEAEITPPPLTKKQAFESTQQVLEKERLFKQQQQQEKK